MQTLHVHRSGYLRLAAVLLLVAQIVVVGLAPMAEGRISVDFPTHVEESGAPPHAGHHPGICAFCVLRHFSPLPTGPSGVPRHVTPHQSIRPEPRLDVIVVRHERPDPARAPPPLPARTTI